MRASDRVQEGDDGKRGMKEEGRGRKGGTKGWRDEGRQGKRQKERKEVVKEVGQEERRKKSRYGEGLDGEGLNGEGLDDFPESLTQIKCWLGPLSTAWILAVALVPFWPASALPNPPPVPRHEYRDADIRVPRNGYPGADCCKGPKPSTLSSEP